MRRTLVVIALLILAGCGLDQPYPDKSYYVFETEAPGSAATSVDATRVIRVPRAAVVPPFSSRALQYRVAPSRYEPSYYHNWADDPGALVAAAATETLAATGAFVVLAPGTDAAGCETLELQITALYVDVTGPTPSVVLALRATLLDDGGAVRLAREFERTEPAQSADAPDAVRAFNDALRAILGDLSSQIAGAIAGAGHDPTLSSTLTERLPIVLKLIATA